MGCIGSSPPREPTLAYFAPGDPQSLLCFAPPNTHNANEELTFVSGQDQKRFESGDECYLVHAQWLDLWLHFAQGKGFPPKGITNKNLLNEVGDTTRANIKPKDDYRPVSKVVWEYLWCRYGGGPVITLKVPAGFTPKQYRKGEWIKTTALEDVVMVIRPSTSPMTNSYPMVHNPMSTREKVSEATASAAANLMMSDLGKNKMKEAKALDADINAANAEAAAAIFAKDLGKKKMEEAKQKEEEQNQAQMENIANIFGGGLEAKLKKEAEEAREAQAAEQQAQAAMIFGNMGARKAFEAARAAGNMKEMELAAAKMLKSAWKSKLARRRAAVLKADKMRLMEEAMARKLQSKWRSKLAQRKVAAAKAEKQRLREEGCAIMLQGAWRIRKSRKKAAELKARKQRLLEEGSALMVQSRWRIKQAQRKMHGLRDQKRKEDEERRLREEEERRIRMAAVFRVAVFMRSILAKIRLRRRIHELPHVLLIDLVSADAINIGDISTSDPFVIIHSESHTIREPYHSTGRGSVSGMSLPYKTPVASPSALKVKDVQLVGADGRPYPVLRSASRAMHVQPLDPRGSHTNSMYQSKVISSTLNPVWNEQCMLTNVGVDDQLVLTLMDKDTFSNSDFLGQISLPLAKFYDSLLEGKEVEVPAYPIGDFRYQAHDGEGNPLCNSSTETPGKGVMTFNLRMMPHTFTQCGWIQKQAKALIGSGAYKTRYLVLCDGVFSYYDNAHSLGSTRGTLRAKDIAQVKYGPDKNGIFTLELIPAGKGEHWLIHWCDGEARPVINAWLRKIQYACKAKAPINGDIHFDPLHLDSRIRIESTAIR